MREIELLPEKPGVYLFQDNEKILYIGKAKNLKKRVVSYFKSSPNDLKTSFLIKKIKKVEWIVTNNEIEALILENNLIKKHKPPYNIRLIDDKTYPYLKIDLSSDFPTIKFTRQKLKDKSLYFGPYTSTINLKNVMNFIYKNFHLRKCTEKKFKNRIRPCLNYQIKICPAPCCNKISKKDYKKNVKKAILFLKGKNQKLISYLEKEMKQLSNNLEFEKAAAVRDIIKSLESINQTQLMEFVNFFDKDIFYSDLDKKYLYFQVLHSKNGKILDSEFFMFNNESLYSNNIMEEFLTQYYSFGKNVPDKIVLNKRFDYNLLKKYFLKKFNRKVNIKFPSDNSEDYKLLLLAKENMQENIKKNLAKDDLFYNMKFKLNLKNFPNRIDAFDIATFQGKSSVGSRVVFENGNLEKNLYRKYIIKTVDENSLNDFAMMYEVVKRSIREYKENNIYPDLILIDGGKGQLGVGEKALKEEGLFGKIDIIALAKDKEDKIDKVYLSNRKNYLNLKNSNDITNFLMKIRDEVHRFSVSFHRERERNKIFESLLKKIPGVGVKRAKALLMHFKSVENIKKADFAELENLPFLNSKVAKNIVDFFKHQ